MKKLILTFIAGLLISPAASAVVLFDAESAIDQHKARLVRTQQPVERQTTGELSRAHMNGTEAFCAYANTRKNLPPGAMGESDGSDSQPSGAGAVGAGRAIVTLN